MLAVDRHMEGHTIRESRQSSPGGAQGDEAVDTFPNSSVLDGMADDMRAAAGRVLDLPHPDGASPGEVASVLEQVVGWVDRRARNDDVRIDLDAVPPLARSLLVLLRAALADVWLKAPGALPPTPRILAVWRACESIEGEITDGPPVAGDDWDLDFSDQLSGPRGLELVVEVAHDLRSPLTSILFLAETLQRGQSGPVNDIQRRQLGLIYSAALGLSTLASNVMELARGGSRLAEDSPAPFSVRDLFESVADIVRPMAEEKGLTVRLLPPDADHRLGPAQALARVLLNLTTNAIKFTEEGFVELVAKSTGPTAVEFSVRDTGRGINPEAIETLFRPFRPGPESRGRTFSGTGLGLALCRKLVEAMGSELRYETSPDWGTRFVFSLELPPAASTD